MVELSCETPLLDIALEKRALLARPFCVREKETMPLRATFAHYGRQNRSFEGNATRRQKQQDWMAERVGFEPTSPVLPGYPLSRRALSTAQTPLQRGILAK